MANFMRDGHFATHIRRMHKIYAARHQTLCEAAHQHLNGLMEIVPTHTGLHTIGILPPGIREQDVALAAAEKDIVVTPINRYCITPTGHNGLVLGFSGIQQPEIISGIITLAEVLRKFRR